MVLINSRIRLRDITRRHAQAGHTAWPGPGAFHAAAGGAVLGHRLPPSPLWLGGYHSRIWAPSFRPGVARARRYRSLRREQQARATRARIVAAAARRFLARGYAGTTMRAVAADAGVALPTVELVFGTKARLLKAVIDVAIAGDDEPVPMLDRQWAARARSAAGAAGFAAACAGQLAESAQRAAGLTLVALETARVDTGIAAVAAQLMAQRQVMAAWMADGLLRRAPRRAGVDYATAVDTVWALMDPALFCRLTGDRGWSPARFQDWFADALLRLLLPGTGQQPATASQSPEGHITSIQPELWVDRAAQAVAFY